LSTHKRNAVRSFLRSGCICDCQRSRSALVVKLQVQHIGWDLNTDQVSNPGDLLSRPDRISLLHCRFRLDFSITRQEFTVIDFQSESFAIKWIRSANHGAVTDGMNPSAFFKIQIATGMGTEAVVAIRSEGARRANPV